jgi:alpha-L-fucosidase 2
MGVEKEEGVSRCVDMLSAQSGRRRFLKLSGAIAALLPVAGWPEFAKCKAVLRPTELDYREADPRLWYDTPATESNVLREALPIGNGRLGALVGGDPARDFLYITDGSMWLGGRNARLDGSGQFSYDTTGFGSLVMLAKLYISVSGHGFSQLSDYRRELDLGNGCLRVSYRRDGVRYTREIFASQPDDVIVVRLSQSGGGRYSGEVHVQGLQGESVHGDAARMTGYFSSVLPNGLKYAAAVKAVATTGKLSLEGSNLHFADCEALTLIFCGGTHYTSKPALGYMDSSMDPLALSRDKLEAAARLQADQLLHTHVADYGALFDTISVDLGTSSTQQRELDTWARLQARARSGTPDPELEALYLQFGRYLTIAGSRKRLPTGLQGLWLSDNAPPWMADYHSDINIQMNYWLPDRAGLSDCFNAFVDYCLDQFDSWTAITRTFFNDPSNGFRNSSGKVAGWTIAISTNIYGGNGWWWHPCGSAWLCNNLYQHYQYVPDRDYLARIYPLLKGACEFWEARLLKVSVADPVSGQTREVLIDDADWSPEQGPKDAKGITYAQEWVWDLFGHYQEACAVLGRDADYAAAISRLRKQLYLPQVSPVTGWLEEWRTPDNLGETTHRHLSPLVGLFPGDRLDIENSPSDIMQGVARLLDARGMKSYGWANAWRSICWARLKNADKAYRLLENNWLPAVEHGNGTSANFFDFYQLTPTSDAFQIDANFGTPTAMLEMLLYSRPGLIELLPALPTAWAKGGSIRGVGARGGFLVDMSWREGKVVSVRVHSVGGTRTMVKIGGKAREVSLRAGESVLLQGE